MLWILLSLAALILIALLYRIRSLRAGARLASELVSGDFGNSPVAEQLATWFRERPSRNLQQERFVQLATAMGCPIGLIAEHVVRSTMRTWKGSVPYGSSLAEEIDRLIVFDPAASIAQEEKQRVAIDRLNAFKAELRALDNL